jgi:phosphoenolpyruvate carboxykinase (GTP)
MTPTRNKRLLQWVREVERLCRPAETIWIDGSPAEHRRLYARAVKERTLERLDPARFPGCYLHRSAANDVARTEHLTFVCTGERDEAGPNNNWMPPAEAYARSREYLRNAMEGRTLYVIPFVMGRLGSPFARFGVQVTDSLYVVLNMLIMTQAGRDVLRALGPRGTFTRCWHALAGLDEEKRLILHFPDDDTIISTGSGYGGNALLGKKCLALRLASHQGRREGWLAEHMMVIGFQEPDGHVTFIAGAFPSACGKTNLAMIVPPKPFWDQGYRVWTLGDDIAWLRADKDGLLRALNPETGFFGVAPGTSRATNPNMMATIHRNTIFTNVLRTPDRGVWWEGMDGPPPAAGTNWQGLDWSPGAMSDSGKPLRGAHPNSRFTAPVRQCPVLSRRFDDPEGVPLSAIIFGTRLPSLTPLIYEARTWQNGVYSGATMSSVGTAAQVGGQGEVRRDPMAMAPFCGYHLGDYFGHWLTMGNRLAAPPRIYRANWFRQDADRRFLWPGFGENFRVLKWIVERCRYRANAVETPLGLSPARHDLDFTGLDMPDERWDALMRLDSVEWKAELHDQANFFNGLGARLPGALRDERDAVARRFGFSA